MFPDIFKRQPNRHVIYGVLRLVIVTTFSIWMYQLASPLNLNFDSLRFIIIPAFVGLVPAAVVVSMAFIRQVKLYIPFVAVPADWLLVGVYVYFFPTTNALILANIAIIITLSGLLHVGAIFGGLDIIGSLIITVLVFAYRARLTVEVIADSIEVYLPTIILTLLVYLVMLVWSYSLDEENSKSRKDIRKEIEVSSKRLADMRERTSSIADLATRLNATLNFDRILDAALDIGRMSVHTNASDTLKSMALMVSTEDGRLTIESARGLQFNDMHYEFAGQHGVIAQAMELGEPVIHDGGSEEIGRAHV